MFSGEDASRVLVRHDGDAAPAGADPELCDVTRARFAVSVIWAVQSRYGEGRTSIAKSLVVSRWALAPAPQVIRIVLHGKEGEMLMPPIGQTLTNDQLANVLTYVRRSWGNAGTPISPTEVAEARGASMGRKKAWTEAELAGVRR